LHVNEISYEENTSDTRSRDLEQFLESTVSKGIHGFHEERAPPRRSMMSIKPDGASRDKTRLTEITKPVAIYREKVHRRTPVHPKGERFRDLRNGAG
jgi:hypothetical protein